MRQKKEKEKIGKKICDALEISSDILSDVPRFTINDNCEMQIENYEGVLEYTDSCIRLMAKKYEIKIEGQGLAICCITDEQVYIKGVFRSINYIF